MAFVPIISLGKRIARCTGASLAPSQAITFGFFGDAGASFQLPSEFPGENEIRSDDSMTPTVDIDVRVHPTGQGAGTVGDVRVTKGGSPFRITLTNPDGANTTKLLEIYFEANMSRKR